MRWSGQGSIKGKEAPDSTWSGTGARLDRRQGPRETNSTLQGPIFALSIHSSGPIAAPRWDRTGRRPKESIQPASQHGKPPPGHGHASFQAYIPIEAGCPFLIPSWSVDLDSPTASSALLFVVCVLAAGCSDSRHACLLVYLGLGVDEHAFGEVLLPSVALNQLGREVRGLRGCV